MYVYIQYSLSRAILYYVVWSQEFQSIASKLLSEERKGDKANSISWFKFSPHDFYLFLLREHLFRFRYTIVLLSLTFFLYSTFLSAELITLTKYWVHNTNTSERDACKRTVASNEMSMFAEKMRYFWNGRNGSLATLLTFNAFPSSGTKTPVCLAS